MTGPTRKPPPARRPGSPGHICAGLLALLAGCSAWSASSDQDLANERFYTPPEAMEKHWGVQCVTLLRRIDQQLDAGGAATPDARALQSLLDELQKCAMIHNPPGSETEHSHPNYANGQQLLQQWLDAGKPADSVPELMESIRRQLPSPVD